MENMNFLLKMELNLNYDLVYNISGSIDGINSARLLNKEYFLPIIFTTAYGDSQTINEATDTNIFAYLIKPFEKIKLDLLY